MSEDVKETRTRIEAYTETKVHRGGLDIAEYDPDYFREGYEIYAYGTTVDITPEGLDVKWWVTDEEEERLNQPDVQYHLVWVPELVALVPKSEGEQG